MALIPMQKYFGKGYAWLHGQRRGSLYSVLRELRGLTTVSVQLAAAVDASTDGSITVTGVATGDHLLSVTYANAADGTDPDLTSVCSISGANTITTTRDIADAANLIVSFYHAEN